MAIASPTAEIPACWQKKFSLLEKAGGPKLTKLAELDFKERCKVIFNLWGFLFGPLYYIAKGMWKKAIVLSALCAIAIVTFELIARRTGGSANFTGYIAPAVFASRANIDYYKKVILGKNGWW